MKQSFFNLIILLLCILVLSQTVLNQPGLVTTTPVCVSENSSLGPYHADGMLTIYQPLNKSEVITLEKGSCTARVLTEISTITTDLSHLFTAMTAGANCIFIVSQREPNIVALMPSIRTYPPLGQDVISTTETVNASEYRSMVNFDWFTSSNSSERKISRDSYSAGIFPAYRVYCTIKFL